MKYRILRTNLFINVTKFVLILPIILVNSLLFKIFDFYGVEWILTILIYAVLIWFYRINYLDNIKLKSKVLNISVKTNLLGFCFVKVKINGETIKKLMTRNRDFFVEDKVKSLYIHFKVGNDRKKIEYKVNE